MPAAAKTHPIKKTEILIGRHRPRLFLVSHEQALGVAHVLKDYEVTRPVTNFIDAHKVLPELADATKRPGVVLRGLRLRDVLTQAELARRLGCPQPWISQMESGVRPIGRKMATRLSKVFKTDPKVFF